MESFNPVIFNKMSENYQSLLESGTLSDAVLVVGKKELRIHKVILSARSPVFAAMFTNEFTKEAQENRVEIIDVDVEVLELLVRYIYTGKVETLDQHVAELYVAADKYQVNCLKSICEKQLLSMVITTESVSDLLILADTHQVTELTNKCLDYITNNCNEVMASEGWKKIEVKPYLVVQLLKNLNLKYTNVTNNVNGEKKAEPEKEEESDDDDDEQRFGLFD